MRRPATALLLLGLVVTMGLAASVTASPQPTPVCGVCGGGLVFGTSGTDELRGLTVEESTATIRIHDDGSATWDVTNHVGNESAVSYLHEHPAALDRLVAEALEYSTVEGPFRNVSASIDGDRVSIRFEDPTAARRMPGGVLVVDYLHTRGYDSWPVITADRLTIVGPAGTTVTNSPPGARVEGRNATWHGNASVPLYEASSVERDAYVTFAEGGLGVGLWTTLAVALATAPIVVAVLTETHLAPLGLLALGLLAITAAGRLVFRRWTLPDTRRVGLGVAGLGALAFVPVALGEVLPQLAGHRWVLELGVMYLTLGAVAYWRGSEARLGHGIAAGLLALVGIGLAHAFALPGEYVTRSEAVRSGVNAAIHLLPVLAMLVLGATVADGTRRGVVGGILAVLGAFLLAELTVVWPTQRPFGLVLIFFLAGAAAVVLLGLPMFILGCVIRSPEGPADRTGSSSSSTVTD